MLNTKKIVDISMDLNEKTVVWIQDPPPQLKPICRQPEAPINFTWLDFGAHAGTHVDAPFYLYQDKWTSDQIPFNFLIGPCQVLDLTDVKDTIEVSDLKKHSITQQRVLLKTQNSFDPMAAYNPQHIAMSIAAAKYLVRQGVITLGYDYQSFEREGNIDLHRVFMEADVIMIDNLRLKEAKAQEYELICLPIKVTGIDAGPARAILVEK